jgi:hypothetical protein
MEAFAHYFLGSSGCRSSVHQFINSAIVQFERVVGEVDYGRIRVICGYGFQNTRRYCNTLWFGKEILLYNDHFETARESPDHVLHQLNILCCTSF